MLSKTWDKLHFKGQPHDIWITTTACIWGQYVLSSCCLNCWTGINWFIVFVYSIFTKTILEWDFPSVQCPLITFQKFHIPISIDIPFLSKHISLYALGRIRWILDIIWPLHQHFKLKNQRNWLTQVWMWKFWSVINCFFCALNKET